MKYAIIKCTDGNFAVHGEYPTPEAAKMAYHQYLAALWNDTATSQATVKIVDEQFDCVDRCQEYINRTEASNVAESVE